MSYSVATLYLSSSGDSFHSKVHSGSYRDVNFETDNVHPALKEASQCKTHQAVQFFLKKVEADPNFLNYVDLYHVHNFCYSGHHSFKGRAHKESIHEMQAFVEKKKNHILYMKISLVVFFLLAAVALITIGICMNDQLKKVIFLGLGIGSFITSMGLIKYCS